jgi:hypothetical protein
MEPLRFFRYSTYFFKVWRKHELKMHAAIQPGHENVGNE